MEEAPQLPISYVEYVLEEYCHATNILWTARFFAFHRITLVMDHDTNKVVWGAQGKDSKTLGSFFEEVFRGRIVQDPGGFDGYGPGLP